MADKDTDIINNTPDTPKKINVALAGNPNSGKTTIFNNLTGARQHVANYPGVTVEVKEGKRTYRDTTIEVVDLPGTYSLTAYSKEELVARNYIIEQQPDVIVDVIDASNLERNLYLAVQFMELDVPLILVFNQSDIAEKRGISFDINKLSSLLDTPIILSVGNKNIGTQELLDTIVTRTAYCREHFSVGYGKDIDNEIDIIRHMLEQTCPLEFVQEKSKWFAIKLIEDDEEAVKLIQVDPDSSCRILEQVDHSRTKIRTIYGTDPEVVIAERRYGFISGACQGCIQYSAEQRHNMSDKIDNIILSKAFGVPLFLVMMYVVFWLTFKMGTPFISILDTFFSWMGDTISSVWPAGSAGILKSLIVDGIIGGVGGVLTFLPTIMLLFMAISILEDSGYMARAAFIMDRTMNKIGLHGKSFIPLLTGFGCSVPGIMATRTLEHEHDRLTTMLVLPLISCGARLPIYALIIPAFFPHHWQAPMLWVIYIVGILLAVGCAKLLRASLFRGEQTPFVLELPPYRVPTVKGVLIHMWEKGYMYIKKAGTLILGMSIILWVFSTFPNPPESRTQGLTPAEQHQLEMSYSMAGRFGQTIEPALKPLGFDWRIGSALVGALAAKEVFVAQLGIIFAVTETDDEEASLRTKLRNSYSSLSAFCIMIFTLISAPCIATFAVTKKESNSWRWAFFQFFGLTGLAYLVTLIVYQIGSFVLKLV